MYSYDKPPATRLIIHPSASAVFRMPLALDDYLILQSLLREEQERQERVALERLRLQQALYNLKQLKERYRRERCRRIQHCLDAFRRQALIRQAQEDVEYRQLIAAAVERQRMDDMWKQYQQQRLRIEREEEQFDDEQGFRDFRAEQLGELLRLAFGKPCREQQKEVEKAEVDVKDKAQEEEEEKEEIEEEQTQDTQSIQDLWKYIVQQQQEKEEEEAKEQEQEYARSIDRSEEIPRSSFLAPEHEKLQEATLRNRQPSLHDQTTPLKNLVDELVRAPVNVGDQSETWSDNNAVEQSTEEEGNEEEEEGDVEEEATMPTTAPMFVPQEIITEAEPTPIQEHDVSMDYMDPYKAEKLAALHDIQKQLDDIQERKEAAILSSSLSFQPTEKPRPLVLPATTKNNRAYLGYEDEIMQVLLKLDAIESGGDRDVRQVRKQLVKQAETMLERLDDHKQQEWRRLEQQQQKAQQQSVYV
ncbi:hypothetical protein EC973_003473 [Apophysomyces ossiformis]|uniref:BAG domain-containing protein n=1 Tax=Apophysomyces ossiformis TaxID=679940 RepID=A0A8H7EL51_9FUNG|nr:hypothetical protein EC973_003473 [Apophysomyces ossiformis]